ncbi:MAG: hypothetical protein JNM25_11435 [Planctomycetes bacterium]|nr:hypothetical protein [Planctomycetota bacterium]
MSDHPLIPFLPAPRRSARALGAGLLLLLGGPWLGAQQPATTADPQRGPMLLPQAVVLPRGEREIVIDGTLTDWPELPAIRLDDQRQLSGTAGNAWRGPKDLSAFGFLLWDADALYVAFSVRDEWHRALAADSLRLTEIPAADSVVLTFDPNRDTRSIGPDPGRREDREFWLADEVGRQVVQWDRLRGTARVLDADGARVVVLHDKEASITSYEARIPWREVLPPGRDPVAGLVFDMQIVVNDFDESTDPMPQTRIGWTFGCGPIVDPGLLASVMLVADAAPLQGQMPDFPPKPSVAEPPVPLPAYWQDLTARLLQSPPAVHDGTQAPEQAGGLKRFTLLDEIEDHCARFPRVDLVEFDYRIHRRMTREVAGIQARGLPRWWRERLLAVSKAAEDPVPNATVRLFRLPMGGWLLRTPTSGFLVDAAGGDLAEWLWGGAAFCILTQPLDMSRRNDQLLLRMLLADPPRPVATHITFHLPVVSMEQMPLLTPGQAVGAAGGTRVHALGAPQPDGKVTWSCSYVVTTAAGPKVLLVGPDLRPEELEDGPFDVMILSPRNPEALAIARRAAPGLVVIDDTLLCQSRPDVARMRLRSLHNLQRQLLPLSSLILAPGESWDVRAATAK